MFRFHLYSDRLEWRGLEGEEKEGTEIADELLPRRLVVRPGQQSPQSFPTKLPSQRTLVILRHTEVCTSSLQLDYYSGNGRGGAQSGGRALPSLSTVGLTRSNNLFTCSRLRPWDSPDRYPFAPFLGPNHTLHLRQLEFQCHK